MAETEQEWLEHHADLWMRDRNITPTFSPDLPPVSDCGWRMLLDAADIGTGKPPYQRIKDAEWVVFYAVFDGHEVTTERPANGMNWSVPAWQRTRARVGLVHTD